MSLHDALGGMRDRAQWFLWRLVWNPEKAKFDKTPCALDGSAYRMDASLPQNWNSYSDVCVAWQSLDRGGTERYALGFWMTADCGYWFYDLDKCIENGAVNARTAQIMAAFPGALMEFSSSVQGVHIIGRGLVPPHRSRDVHGWHMEFYTSGRGIAFGLSGQAQGSADTVHDASVQWVVANYFPPRPEAEPIGEGARADWRGPADDDELIRRMMASRPSANVVFGGKASIQQLWTGQVEHSSEHDMALAAHLAFWTGCDEERMVRLMLRSGLKRAKWGEHRTYLRELTVRNAIAGCTAVYQEPVRDNTATVVAMYGQPSGGLVTVQQAAKPISEEQEATYKLLSGLIDGCGTVTEMHNDVLPALAGSGLPPVLLAGFVAKINKQLVILGADKIPVGQLRRLLSPPIVQGSDAPLWVLRHCYVKDTDRFYDTETGAEMTVQGFQAEYTRVMPLKENGQRENPVEWALNRWGMRTVQRIAYRPDKPTFFEWDGLEHVNRYSPNSVPVAATEFTEAGVRGIEAFKLHLWDMCGRREPVFNKMLWWIAHNVQNPGVKIRWSPVLKGVHGDGKTLLSAVVRAVMGYRNTSVTGNSMLTNSGGFTDWAMRAAVNFIEEIMLVGKARHQLYNAMKEYISNDIISINSKGGKAAADYYNITNHFALTNHNDAIPMEPTDRRWFVVYTPWYSLEDMYRYCGLSEAAWEARAAAIDYCYKHCAGEMRAWLLSVPIGADFKPNASAMMTEEKRMMTATSQDDIEGIALQIIEDGAVGVSKSVFASSSLSNLLRLRANQDGLDVPKTTGLSHMFTRMGFSKLPKDMKWRGQSHTIWIKNGFAGDARSELDQTVPK